MVLRGINSNVPSFQSQELEQDLASWATKSKCTRSALNDLLVILRKQGHRLPKDARTLLRTPRTVEIAEKCGGKYLYLGLETGLLKLVCQNIDFFKDNEDIQLIFNIDGVPLFKSTSLQMSSFGPFYVLYKILNPLFLQYFVVIESQIL